MNLHKYKSIPKIYQPKTIYWKPLEVKYPPKKLNPTNWEIYTQKPLTLKPGETKAIVLSFGFMMGKGVVLVSLSQNLKIMELKLSNEVILEDVNDVVVYITNITNKQVKIDENIYLCRIYYSIQRLPDIK